jgi:outer membrane lipoprotein SlyB
MTRKLAGAGVLVLVVGLAGCVTSRSGDVYTRDEAMREQAVRFGVVEQVRPVTIEGTRSGVGAAAGAVAGGIAGSTVGHGEGSAVAAVVGAVVGGVAGQAVEEGTTQRQAMEITVRLDSGQMVAIVQETTETFNPGDRVRIISGGGTSRVSH